MLTSGDAFSIVALFVGFGLTSWALIAVTAFLFPNRVGKSADATMERPWRAFRNGLGMLVAAAFALALLASPMPVLKLLGWPLFMAILMVGIFGAGSISFIAARRLHDLAGGNLNEYAAFLRGTGFLVTGCLLPGVGWFLFLPVVLVMSLGAGWIALVSVRKPKPEFSEV